MERKSFVFYTSFYEAIECIPRDRDKIAFFRALCRYALYGEEPQNLSGTLKGLFLSQAAAIDANNERFMNGKKGGRPKLKKPVVSDEITSGKKSEKYHIYDENENENENVNENEDVNGEVNAAGKPATLSPPAQLIMFLNERGGRAFQMTEKNLGLASRLLDRYGPEIVYPIVGDEIDRLKKDPTAGVWISPGYLFKIDNFEAYKNELPTEGGDL